VPHGPDHLWYDHGHWYRHDGPDWVVGSAPFGVLVPKLPPFYTTIWFGGVPYYYANDTYYEWDTGQNQYEVVEPPAGIETGATTTAPDGTKLFVYPKNGQSPAQQSTDQFDCYRYAKEQTGYDPTRSDGGVAAQLSASKRKDYLRADSACLEGRGYSVN
jgi:hypothetical protein